MSLVFLGGLGLLIVPLFSGGFRVDVQFYRVCCDFKSHPSGSFSSIAYSIRYSMTFISLLYLYLLCISIANFHIYTFYHSIWVGETNNYIFISSLRTFTFFAAFILLTRSIFTFIYIKYISPVS